MDVPILCLHDYFCNGFFGLLLYLYVSCSMRHSAPFCSLAVYLLLSSPPQCVMDRGEVKIEWNKMLYPIPSSFRSLCLPVLLFALLPTPLLFLSYTILCSVFLSLPLCRYPPFPCFPDALSGILLSPSYLLMHYYYCAVFTMGVTSMAGENWASSNFPCVAFSRSGKFGVHETVSSEVICHTFFIHIGECKQ